VVFGCGGDRDRAKRPEMGRVAAGLADVVIVTSDNPRSEDPMAIIDEVLAGIPAGVEPLVIADRREAIAAALAGRRPEDVVIVAGKGHEQGQTAGGVTVPFDDRTVAREELARLGWSAQGTSAPGTAACA
jgi:UDP-N-acetylmuramoyl-L-alanyl-D-glutamate--2,6-diaminopimelate ligase